jgi:hypothetical protein
VILETWRLLMPCARRYITDRGGLAGTRSAPTAPECLLRSLTMATRRRRRALVCGLIREPDKGSTRSFNTACGFLGLAELTSPLVWRQTREDRGRARDAR